MVSPGQGGDGTLIRRRAHKITIDPSGTAKTAGFTHGNLTLTITVNKQDRVCAEYGTTAIDKVVTGEACVAKWTMMELSLKVLKIALQGIYPYVSGSGPGTVGVGRSGIQLASTLGKQILLHPISGPNSNNTNEDITLQLAMITPTGNIELSDQGDEMWEVEADCIVSPSATDGELLAIIGAANAGA